MFKLRINRLRETLALLIAASLLAINSQACNKGYACDTKNHNCVDMNFKYSQDNGQTWHDANVDASLSDTSVWGYFKCSPDVKNCFKAGEGGNHETFIQAVYTTDYGKSWQKAPMCGGDHSRCESDVQRDSFESASCDSLVKYCSVHATCPGSTVEYMGNWD